jgi:hypothetical protein
MIVQSRTILIVAAALFGVFASAAIWLVLRLVRSNRAQVLVRAALVPTQTVTLREPGEIVLIAEVPRFGSDFRKWEFEVIEQATGQGTKLQYDSVRAQGAVYGLTTARVPIGRLTAPRPGPYALRVSGLEAGKDYSRSRILLSKPYLGRMVIQILGIVGCGIGMLLSLLTGLWQIFPLETGGSPVPSTASATPNVPRHTIDLETLRRQSQQAQPSPK